MKTLFSFVVLFFTIQLIGASVNRIVSLAPSISMNLHYLDCKKKLVGCTSYCEIAKPDHVEIVATAVKVNIEKVFSLKPDVIFVSTLTNPETIEQFRKLGLRVEVIGKASSFDDICTQFLFMGKIVGKEELAKSIITKSKAEVSKIRKQNEKKPKTTVFFQIGAKPLFSVLSNTFMDDYIQFCGATNIAADQISGTIGREMVLKKNPDYIFIGTMGIVGEEEKKVWESFGTLKAVQQKRIYTIDSNLACTPTPVSFVETLKIMNQLMYPRN